jgi:hypothetical protein
MQSSGCTTNAVSGGDGLIFLMPKKPAEKSQNPLASLNFDFLNPRFLIGFSDRVTRLGLLFIKFIMQTFPNIVVTWIKIFFISNLARRSEVQFLHRRLAIILDSKR